MICEKMLKKAPIKIKMDSLLSILIDGILMCNSKIRNPYLENLLYGLSFHINHILKISKPLGGGSGIKLNRKIIPFNFIRIKKCKKTLINI